MNDKPALRARMRAVRDAFAADAPPLPVPAAFGAMLRPNLVLASYVPVIEADPAPLEDAARAADLVIALPHVVDRATPLRFLRHDGPLVPGPFRLRQPPEDAPEVIPDIILTPLVAFDDALNRLGQGAGHYDRAFAAFPDARRIGIAWSVQRVDALVPDPWDVPLHAIVTERGWIER